MDLPKVIRYTTCGSSVQGEQDGLCAMRSTVRNGGGGRRNHANAALRTALERDLFLRLLTTREHLRRVGESFDSVLFSDGLVIVSAGDSDGDLRTKVIDLLGD